MKEKIQLESNRGPNPDPQITKTILKFLEEERLSYILEIAGETGSDRVTVLKHLEKLKEKGIVEEERKGNMRLFKLPEKRNQDGDNYAEGNKDR